MRLGFVGKAASAAMLAATMVGATTAVALASTPTPTSTAQDPFYTYTGSTPLAQLAPGTVLKTRTESYHVLGIATPLPVVQLLYRTTNTLDQPSVDVTSVIEPASGHATDVVSYQSFYDSLNPADEPSAQIAGGVSLGGLIPQLETGLVAPFLLAGDAVVIDDTEGEQADFASVREYGYDTLDSLRATLASPATGVAANAKIALVGYSGGAMASQWAAEEAPAYAPDVNSHLVGASIGGVLADPIHNLEYVSGSFVWTGVIPMALIGLSRAYGVDLSSYLSSYGASVVAANQSSSIVNMDGEYPGKTFADFVKPQYADPTSIPPLVKIANQLIMGSDGTPTIPLLVDQGADGVLEGTLPGGSGIGAGDGVMVAGDVRSLATEYCQRGVAVDYNQYDLLSHLSTPVVWVPQTLSWVAGRFAGAQAPRDCSSIAPGNNIAPVPVP